MEKKDLSKLSKSFVIDSNLYVSNIKSIFMKKDTRDELGDHKIILNHEENFNIMSEEKQSLYFKGFKKLVGGTLNSKIFNLAFKKESEFQKTLFETDKDKKIGTILKSISDNYTYDGDVVITIAECNLSLDEMLNYEFIVTTVCTVKASKAQLYCDTEQEEIDITRTSDVIINSESPIEGFIYPTFEEGSINLSHMLYYNSKPKEMDKSLVEKKFEVVMERTIYEDKDIFTDIINSGDVSPEQLSNVYEKLNFKAKEIEEKEGEVALQQSELTYDEIKEVLEECSIEINEEIIKEKEFNIKLANIIPTDKKELKFSNKEYELKLVPSALEKIQLIKNKQGKDCICIEVDLEEFNLSGIELKRRYEK